MKKLLLSAIVGVLACGNVMADKWVLIDVDFQDKSAWNLNLSSLHKDKNNVSGWLALVYAQEPSDYDLELVYLDVDCKKMRGKILENQFFLEGNYVRKAKRWYTYEYMAPGTLFYGIGKAMCKPNNQDAFEGDPFVFGKQQKLRLQGK